MRSIERCRTAALGGHVDVCSSCGTATPSYNSCRNRHCPKCQGLAQAKWLEGRKQRILPTHYFHVVFTLPSELRPLTRLNPRLVYGLLFEAASQTLLELGRDPERLGATLGITAVLHTWSRTLAYHPHVHCVVTGGGLSLDHARWVATSRKFLFPLPVMAQLFRGKMLCALRRAHRRRELRLPDDLVETSGFDVLVDTMFATDWVVYAKPPFGGPDNVYAYLGRYTHRVGLSNHRLRAIDGEHVTFVGRNDKLVRLTHDRFIHRGPLCEVVAAVPLHPSARERDDAEHGTPLRPPARQRPLASASSSALIDGQRCCGSADSPRSHTMVQAGAGGLEAVRGGSGQFIASHAST